MNKKKKITLLGTTLLGVGLALGSVSWFGHSGALQRAFADNPVDWGHYSLLKPTGSSAGSKEFWISCGDHSVQFTAPESYKQIYDRGTPTVQMVESWGELDSRYLPAFNENFSYLANGAATVAWGEGQSIHVYNANQANAFGISAAKVNELIAGGANQISMSWSVNWDSWGEHDDTDELVFFDGGYQERYFNTHGQSGTVTLNLTADQSIQIWAQRNHGGVQNKEFVLSDITLLNPKASARSRLASIFTSEGNCWTYIRHNGWGVNSWGTDCTKAVFGTDGNGQSNIQIQNVFLQDMKTAGYTKVSFHIKGVSVTEGKEIKDIALTTSGTHTWSWIYYEVQNVSETTFTLDLTDKLPDLADNDFLIVAMRTAQPEVANVPSIITVSDLVFSLAEEEVQDASIKELQTNKQVRRVEQQDAWKSPIGSASNEEGHKEFWRYGSRDVIHLSAHYANDDPKFTYNNNWSEWRFTHSVSNVTTVTFSYVYTDSNNEVDSDGGETVHTMAQWYDDTKTISANGYIAVGMDLVADGTWHTITVASDGTLDITHFVMKIYHFTGDIYISNIVYSNAGTPTDEANITNASIKELQTNKQVRRLEQQDHWKTDPDYATYNNESGHADYYKFGTRDAIHFSAHYESTDPKFSYNSAWSEWRFTHAVTNVTSVTVTYLYTDSNTDTSADGGGTVHTMAQWYNDNEKLTADSKYLAATMNLVNDGEWHTITVTADGTFDITHFVFKIYHFTGDIYISNIVYA